ncbi:MAG: 2-amino-4-hydroxy-6-hydroxymethyldihydropteridine diphosphokinase [Lentisphaerae bacterium]|nr:2-amino-4-hydroxy-6-hydroxymethyldihydropteridine diphosphokinase [Lentisphaerota bacterium]
MKNMSKIALMLGGNLPGTPEAMSVALVKLSDAGVENIRNSAALTSEAVDCVPGTPDFLDMAVTGDWGGSAPELLALCQRLEREAGRPEKHSSRESRILDCDIILFGDEVFDLPELTIPHPRACGRLFVLEPLAQIAPEMRFPGGMSVIEALHDLQQRQNQ